MRRRRDASRACALAAAPRRSGRAHVHLRAARAGAPQLVHDERDVRLAAAGYTLRWWQAAGRTRACAPPSLTSVRGRAARGRDRRGARHARVDGVGALRVLRPRRRLAARAPADRAARHRHRHRAEHAVPQALGRADVLHARRRARHVLHRHRGTTTPRAAAADVLDRRGGVARPRRHPVDDLVAGHVPGPARRAASAARCWRSRCPSTRSS